MINQSGMQDSRSDPPLIPILVAAAQRRDVSTLVVDPVVVEFVIDAGRVDQRGHVAVFVVLELEHTHVQSNNPGDPGRHLHPYLHRACLCRSPSAVRATRFHILWDIGHSSSDSRVGKLIDS
jgi:hypothetical protein